MKITFIRHTAVAVSPGVCYGRSDVGLKETFPEEASKVKENLLKKGCDYDAVFRSPASRCRLLAEACGFPEAMADPRIWEMNFGEWEMQSYDEIKDPRLQQWFDDWMHITPPGGESFIDQNRRVASFLEEIRGSSYDNVLVFTHAGVMMNVMLLLGLTPIEGVFADQPPYGGFLEVELKPGQTLWRL